MDQLGGLLDPARARGAFKLRIGLDPPWSVRVEDRAPLGITAVVRGSAWLLCDGLEPVALDAGDVAVLRGPDAYLMADSPSTPPQAVVHPDQSCTAPDGGPLADFRSAGVRNWGNAPDGATVLVTGSYTVERDLSRGLLRTLPQRIVVRRDEMDGTVADLLAGEITRDLPGQETMLDRLLDVLVITTVRAWFARADVDEPGWYRANADPVVGPVIRAICSEPAAAWTVERMARHASVSRAALARRFTQVVGEPPMAFLTRWRIALAADLLREGDASLATVAREVGYSTPFALSAAFKRVRGVSPREHRRSVGAVA